MAAVGTAYAACGKETQDVGRIGRLGFTRFCTFCTVPWGSFAIQYSVIFSMLAVGEILTRDKILL